MSSRRSKENGERAERSAKWEETLAKRARVDEEWLNHENVWQKKLAKTEETLAKKQEIHEMECRLSGSQSTMASVLTPACSDFNPHSYISSTPSL